MGEPRYEELQLLGDYLMLHPLAIEDAGQSHQRPKQECYGDVLPAAVKTLWFVEQTADVETGEVMIFLGSSFALTVRHGANDPTVQFRDAIQPLVPVMQPFTTARDGWPRQVVPYFRDVADHLTRTDTEVRALDDLLVSILDAHLAKAGTWQNDVMRRVSAWAAIVAIPTMVAGIYGMNFDHMLELDWRYGYPCALAVMALGAGLLYPGSRRNGCCDSQGQQGASHGRPPRWRRAAPGHRAYRE